MQISDGERQMDVSLQKCMQLHKAPPATPCTPSVQLERLFSWIRYEMPVDKYANMNIENIYSVLTLWVDTFNMLTKSLQF